MKIERTRPRGVYVRQVPQYPGKLFAQMVTVADAAATIHISGTFAFDERCELIGEGSMRLQVRQALKNIGACLASIGAGPAQVLRTKIYVTDIDAYVQEGHSEWLAFFGEHLPASTTVQIVRLTDPRCLVEIEAYAALGRK
jgi:enamine deaminase RidA (YjgF/YER057c/UK114 family)